MDEGEIDMKNSSYTLKGSSETLLPIHLYEFKAHLLEAVEELRMGRLAKIQYEEQVNKILMEKQELMWKCEAISNQEEIVEKKHNDSLAALKKQLQAKMCLIEEEKGRFQLAAESKERENSSLREDIKTLQIAKYNFQKKVHEMEQKLQLHILAKEDHIKQLSECKRCIGNVTQQFGMIKEVHEKLEQTVQTAILNNKKNYTEINKKNEEIEHLKEEIKRLSSDLLNYKVIYKQRANEENIILSEKEQNVNELKERLQTEKELNKKLMEEHISMKKGKQLDIRVLSNMQTLVQRHTQTNISLENQLSELMEDNKTLKRDNELQRAKATENEENFLALQSEHQKALSEWKAQFFQKEHLEKECDTVKKELELMKQLNLQKCNSESLQKTPETIIQAEEQRTIYSMDIVMCNIEDNMTKHGTPSDPAAYTTTAYVGSSDDISLSLRSNEIQKIDGSKIDIVHKDKGHLCEEQNDESLLTENKESYPTVERSTKESCDGKCTEEIPSDRTCMNIINEYEKSMDKDGAALQTQVMAKSINMLPDNNKPQTVCNEDASQQTDSSHCKPEDDSSEDIYIVIDKPDRPDNDRGVFINETCSKESQLLNQSIKELINEQPATGDISPTGDNPNCALGDESNCLLPVLYRDSLEICIKSGQHDQIRQAEPIKMTDEDPLGIWTDSLFSKKNQRVDSNFEDAAKHCMDIGTTLNTSVNTIDRAESKRKCFDQEAHCTTSYSSLGQVGNSDLKSALELYEDCTVQSLQCTENPNEFIVEQIYTNGRESCSGDTGKDSILEEKTECDTNVNGELHSDDHDQPTGQTSDPVNMGVDEVCIQENDNVAAGCMSQVVQKSYTELAATKEEKYIPDGKSLNLSNLPKSVYLLGSDLRDSLNISLSNRTHHNLSKLSEQAVYSRAEHVPKDHSAEWNAEHHSSAPILATTSEKSNMLEKPNFCPVVTDATKSHLINLPHTTHTEVTGSNKDDDDDICSIQSQISAIEKFLLNNTLNGSRKRKHEDTLVRE
ncbi:coiled-coil domain-containing protein 73 isoform X3 [Hyla sarda]|uniref:coiled-coil domain-containing protein 73 isoform X3 n=1 Tax=Hyla sarda TaxID=327740 RepID=UPI0024C366AA|nr:coiled-coil domain-containing protein 73 isoform X3 [Hyla sarda]